MSAATARAYRSRFAGRFMPSESRKSPEIKPFCGCRDTYSRKAYCIEDSVLFESILPEGFSKKVRGGRVAHGGGRLPKYNGCFGVEALVCPPCGRFLIY